MRRETIHALAKQSNLALVRNQRTADEIEQSRLSRSIRPHDAKNVSCLNGQTDVPDGGHTAKRLGYFIESEKRHEMFDSKALYTEFTAKGAEHAEIFCFKLPLHASTVN